MATLITNEVELGLVVRYHRKRARLTRESLSKLAGVGMTAIFELEHARKSVRLGTLLKILNVLNLSFLLDGPLVDAYVVDELDHC